MPLTSSWSDRPWCSWFVLVYVCNWLINLRRKHWSGDYRERSLQWIHWHIFWAVNFYINSWRYCRSSSKNSVWNFESVPQTNHYSPTKPILSWTSSLHYRWSCRDRMGLFHSHHSRSTTPSPGSHRLQRQITDRVFPVKGWSSGDSAWPEKVQRRSNNHTILVLNLAGSSSDREHRFNRLAASQHTHRGLLLLLQGPIIRDGRLDGGKWKARCLN